MVAEPGLRTFASGRGRPPGGVAYAQDEGLIACDPVTDDVWIRRGDEFAHGCSGNRAASVRVVGQAVAGLDETGGDFLRGLGVGFSDEVWMASRWSRAVSVQMT